MKTCIKNLRHGSLHLDVIYAYLKCHVSKHIIKRDILVKKIYVEKCFFKVLILQQNNPLIHDYMIYMTR